jgi:hypothetical protein
MVTAMDWDYSHNPGKISNFEKYNEPQGRYRVSRKVTSRKVMNFKKDIELQRCCKS